VNFERIAARGGEPRGPSVFRTIGSPVGAEGTTGNITTNMSGGGSGKSGGPCVVRLNTIHLAVF
jgi:hypothetical protein